MAWRQSGAKAFLKAMMTQTYAAWMRGEWVVKIVTFRLTHRNITRFKLKSSLLNWTITFQNMPEIPLNDYNFVRSRLLSKYIKLIHLAHFWNIPNPHKPAVFLVHAWSGVTRPVLLWEHYKRVQVTLQASPSSGNIGNIELATRRRQSLPYA